MLRPNDVIAWWRERASRQQHELSQLFDGLLPGGQVVVGGSEAQAQQAGALMGSSMRLGRIAALATAELRPAQPTTFDTSAIVQLLIIAKNEGFHETVEHTLQAVLDLVGRGVAIDTACQAVADQANQIQKL